MHTAVDVQRSIQIGSLYSQYRKPTRKDRRDTSLSLRPAYFVCRYVQVVVILELLLPDASAERTQK